LAVKEPKRTSFSFAFILNTEAELLAWIYDTRPATKQHREDHPMAHLLRLSLAMLTFLFLFYSTTVRTSYFYPLDWAPIAF
jgi:hypothetical protein